MNRIAEVLEQKGIKQTWLCKKIGKSYNMLNAYVCNRRQPSIELLFKIAKVLEVKPYTLIKGSEVVNKNDFIPILSSSFYCDNTEEEGMLSCGKQCDFCKTKN